MRRHPACAFSLPGCPLGYMMGKDTTQAPLTPAVLHILLALSSGERQGYGIMKTLAGIVRENLMRMNQMGRMILRVALVALGLLMVPLVASRVVEGWNWPAKAFLFVYILFFATTLAYALIARKMGAWTYKAGVAVSLVSGFALGWSTMVQTADSGHPERLWFLSVLVVGFIGVCLARLEARGLARTLFAMAATLALIAVILPSGAPPEMARRMAIGHGVFVVLFTASGLLFRHASLSPRHPRNHPGLNRH